MEEKIKEIYWILRDLIPNPVCELNYSNQFQLLIAIILSAQCTDKRVNKVTYNLFQCVTKPRDVVDLGLQRLEDFIKPCGFYHMKAKHLLDTSNVLINNYNGIVPNDMDKLLDLPGVGRKTASVLLAVWNKVPTMPVDTHVFRVSNRLGLSHAKNVMDTEKQLREKLDQDKWIDFHHLLLLFGRYYCKSRNPNCANCVLKEYCEYFKRK